jgi:plasmid stabilization system protein ParE
VNVRWTDWAVEQLGAIEEYVAKGSASAAERLVEAIFERGQSLRSLPRRGRVVPELGREDVRELVHGNYRIVYVIRRDRINVLTVFERHRLLRDEDLAEL